MFVRHWYVSLNLEDQTYTWNVCTKPLGHMVFQICTWLWRTGEIVTCQTDHSAFMINSRAALVVGWNYGSSCWLSSPLPPCSDCPYIPLMQFSDHTGFDGHRVKGSVEETVSDETTMSNLALLFIIYIPLICLNLIVTAVSNTAYPDTEFLCRWNKRLWF